MIANVFLEVFGYQREKKSRHGDLIDRKKRSRRWPEDIKLFI